MDLLKTIWPMSFGVKPGVLGTLLTTILIFFLGALLGGVAIGIIGVIKIPLLGTLLGIVGAIIDVYCIVGIVLSVCKFLGVF